MIEKEPKPRIAERVPAELREIPQWVNWRLVDGRKIPVNPSTLGNAGVRWKTTWSSYEHAETNYTRQGLGLGFVLTEKDPYTCVDLDDCVDPTGKVGEQINEILELLSGWVELSPSGTGLHIWVRNEQPVNRRTADIEVYSSARWMTITGRSNPKAPMEIPVRTRQLAELLTRFGINKTEWAGNSAAFINDKSLWDRIFGGKNGQFYERLFNGDISSCNGDHSLAVILLANHLARVTDLDANRVKRLMYQTCLVRPKWEEPRGESTWIDYQILDAIRFVAGRKV